MIIEAHIFQNNLILFLEISWKKKMKELYGFQSNFECLQQINHFHISEYIRFFYVTHAIVENSKDGYKKIQFTYQLFLFIFKDYETNFILDGEVSIRHCV